jgi:hypothetical protein
VIGTQGLPKFGTAFDRRADLVQSSIQLTAETPIAVSGDVRKARAENPATRMVDAFAKRISK